MSIEKLHCILAVWRSVEKEIRPYPLCLCLLSALGVYLVFSIFNSTIDVLRSNDLIDSFDWLFLATPVLTIFLAQRLLITKPWRQLNKTTLSIFLCLLSLSALPRAIDVADYDLWADENDQIYRSFDFYDWSISEGAAAIQMPPTELHRIRSDVVLFGHSIMTYRWYYFLLGSMAAVITFFVVHLISGSIAWSLAAFSMMALAPFSIQMANEARPYASGLFLAQLALVFFVHHIKNDSEDPNALPLVVLIFLQSICMQSQILVALLSVVALALGFSGHTVARSILTNWKAWLAVVTSLPSLVHILTVANESYLLSLEPAAASNKNEFLSLLTRALERNFSPFLQFWIYAFPALAFVLVLKTFIGSTYRHRPLNLGLLLVPLGFVGLICFTFYNFGNYAMEPRFLFFLPSLGLLPISALVGISARWQQNVLAIACLAFVISQAPRALELREQFDGYRTQWTHFFKEIDKYSGTIFIIKPPLCSYGNFCLGVRFPWRVYPFNGTQLEFAGDRVNYGHIVSEHDDLVAIENKLHNGNYSHIVYYQALKWQQNVPFDVATADLMKSYSGQNDIVVNHTAVHGDLGILVLKYRQTHRPHLFYEYLIEEIKYPLATLKMRDSLIHYYLHHNDIEAAERHIFAFEKLLQDYSEPGETKEQFLEIDAMTLAKRRYDSWLTKLRSAKGTL
jgi:hypothetical protein